MRLFAILAVLASVASFSPAPAAADPALARVSLVLEPLASGLPNPVAIAHAGDGSGRLFIVLQQGIIRIHDGTTLLPSPFLDLDPIVNCCGEEGLLGLAFHPQYESNGFFFVFYVNTSSELVVARYSVSSGDPNVADPNSGSILLQIPHPFTNHNGGQIAFGPDGYLYIATGDGGSGGDPGNRAQNLNELLGKLLRIDVDNGSPYAIPPDNPFVGVAGLDEIWAYGLRNPWRFSFDRMTGDVFIADVGQGNREEIDFQPASSAGGENYGWRRMEGSACFNPSTGCNDGTLVLPILEYTHAEGCSVTGGYRYRGLQFPQLAGLYVYADFCVGDVYTGSDASGVWTTLEQLDTNLSISTFGEDEAGELYLTRWNNPNGTVYRITALPPCNDGIDNDQDGATDYPADAHCRNRLASSPENPECRDGIDNDQDGASDAADAQCASSPQWWNDESLAQGGGGACGLGGEFALLVPWLMARRLRRHGSPPA